MPVDRKLTARHPTKPCYNHPTVTFTVSGKPGLVIAVIIFREIRGSFLGGEIDEEAVVQGCQIWTLSGLD